MLNLFDSALPAQLPKLSPHLRITEGGTDYTGHPTWVMHHPLTNRFFQIGWQEQLMLKFWYLRSPDLIIQHVNQVSTLELSEETLFHFFKFLELNGLVEENLVALKKRTQDHEKAHPGLIMSIIHNYLFFRVPLFRPDRFLAHLLPCVEFIFKRNFFIVMIILLLTSLFLISHRSDEFNHTFATLFSWDGMLILSCGLIIGKICHELGHALSCKRYGLKIPTMGVAFMVLYPMLYTDTSETWKLSDRKKRMIIGAAGIWMECYIAILALFLWNFVPDGALKTTLFSMCTINLSMTLFINASPFARFDGYHILSDYLSIRNMQNRSFLVAKWWLRTTLFGLDLPIPEPLTPKQCTLFVIYAWCCWIYRLILFTGVAIMVYYLFFKILGIILFSIEIFFFILKPIITELKAWWNMRGVITLNKKSKTSFGIMLLFIGILILPWKTTLEIPATVSYEHQRLFAPFATRILAMYVQPGQTIHRGDLLIQLDSPRLQYDIERSNNKLDQLSASIKQSDLSAENAQNRAVLIKEFENEQEIFDGLIRKKNQLSIIAPFDGYVGGIAPSLVPFEWVRNNQMLLALINPNKIEIEAFASAEELPQLNINQIGIFYSENPAVPPITATIDNIAHQNTRFLTVDNIKETKTFLTNVFYVEPQAYHASNFQGNIPIHLDSKNRIVPGHSIYQILLSPKHAVSLQHVERGKLIFKVKPVSLLYRLYQNVGSVLIRESGF